MISNSINKLIEINDEMSSRISLCTTYSEYVNLITIEFKIYSDIIRSFFVGKQEIIKSIYLFIKNDNKNIKDVLDINMSKHMYFDYFEGLYEYIKNLTCITSDHDIDVEDIMRKNDEIMSRDKDFINSIFGGERNEREDSSISDAMKNVELLIDIEENTFDFFIDKITKICGKNDTFDTKYKYVIEKGIDLFVNSIRYFVFNVIIEILNSYCCVEKSIDSTAEIDVENDKKYKLF